MAVARVVEAVYRKGVLEPLEKLGLQEGQRVRILIEEDPILVAREIRAKLKARLKGKDLVAELSHERERLGQEGSH